MKKILLLTLVCYTHFVATAQLQAAFPEDTLTWERQPKADITSDINIVVKALNLPNGAANELRISVGTGVPAGLCQFTPITLTPGVGTSQMSFSFTILRGTNTDNNALYVPLQLSYNDGRAITVKNLVVKVVNHKIAAKQEEDEDASFFSKLTFLNAYNFDFYGKLTSNYVGVFNIYEPGRNRGKRDSGLRFLGVKLSKPNVRKWQWGVNAGVMKINYGLGDDGPSETHRYQNALIHALDSVVPGKKYLRQFNKYTSTVTNSSWSFYCQPLILLNPSSVAKTASKIYFHTHLELLVNKLETKNMLSTVEQDTAVFPDPVPKDIYPIRIRTGDTASRTNTFYNGYFGGGFTFDIKLSHSAASSLFLQFTGGLTTATPGFVSVPNFRGESPIAKWHGFYLVRASFNQRLSDATKLVIAQDIRGLFPRYNPLYATFIGLNIKLDELLKLIKG